MIDSRSPRLGASLLVRLALIALLLSLHPGVAFGVEIVSYSAPAASAKDLILRGGDGNIFFTQGPNKISRISPSGRVNGKRLGTPDDVAIAGIAAGANGNLWITDTISVSIGILELHALAPRAYPWLAPVPAAVSRLGSALAQERGRREAEISAATARLEEQSLCYKTLLRPPTG